jgi:hypothetical protein
MSITSEVVSRAFALVAASNEAIREDAAGRDLEAWRGRQLARCGFLGAGAAAVPVLGYGTIPAELAVLMRWMHRAAIGVGWIKNGVVAEEDFKNILAVWVGRAELNEEFGTYVATRALAHRGLAAGAPIVHLMAKGFALSLERVAAGTLGPGLSQAIAAQLASSVGSKLTTRWMPLVSAGVGAATNVWIVKGILDAAEHYYDFMATHAPPEPAAAIPARRRGPRASVGAIRQDALVELAEIERDRERL